MNDRCENTLLIEGRNEEIEFLLRGAHLTTSAHGLTLDFEALLPIPAEFARDRPPGDLTLNEWRWRLSHWGCKAPPEPRSERREAGRLWLGFDTHATPPTGVVQRLAALYPALRLTLGHRAVDLQDHGLLWAQGRAWQFEEIDPQDSEALEQHAALMDMTFVPEFGLGERGGSWANRA